MTTASPVEPGGAATTADAPAAVAATADVPPPAPQAEPLATPDAGPATQVAGSEAQAGGETEQAAGEAGGDGNDGNAPPPTTTADAAGPPPPPPLVKKRKVALFVAYVGAGFYGMQYNKDLPTIERALRDAIVAAGGIAPSNVGDDFSKIGWSRSARTDRGVSALGQVVSLRLLTPGGTEDDDDDSYDPAPSINAALPPTIRILGAARVTAGFDARKACDRRRYEYVLPAWAFDGRAGVARTDAKAAKEGGEGGGPVTQEAPEEGGSKPFVFDDAARDRVTAILKAYEGTHK
jgi:tRNA U38,U39,U40 pseudouridine synthase TruA